MTTATIVNLTPHPVVMFDRDGMTPTASFPPSGRACRVRAMSYAVGDIDGIPLVRTAFGTEVENLPAPDGRTRYIVSAMVLAAVSQSGTRSTADLLSPDQFVRDGNGNILGCRAFRIA